jgi:hypothetical protein
VALESETVKPDDAVGVTLELASPYVLFEIVAKVRVWLDLAMVMVIASLVFTTKLISASRVTVTEHVPAVNAVSVDPEMEHTVVPLTTA